MRPLALIALLVSAPAFAEVVDRVAAVVNNEIIALSEVMMRIAPELARVNQERDPAKREQLRKEALQRMLDVLIGEKLLEAQQRELNIEVTDQEIDLGI